MNWRQVVRSQPFGVLIGVVAGAMLVGGATIASAHGGDASRIHTCVNSSGLMKVVAPNVACGNNETALDWNQTGPSGPVGPTGATGPQGPTGDAGAQFHVVTNQFPISNYSVTGSVHVDCGLGEIALRGWVAGGTVLLTSSGPDGTYAWTWWFQAWNYEDWPTVASLAVLCMAAPA